MTAAYNEFYEAVAQVERDVVGLIRREAEIANRNERGAVAMVARTAAERLTLLADLMDQLSIYGDRP